MGLYSTNKIASVEEANNDIEYAQIMQELDEAVFDPSFGHIMEASIQLYENDQRMFDALIECDFMSAMNEAVMLEDEAAAANDAADEKKKGKIGESIKRIFEGAINAIKKAFANVITKIKALVSKDSKLAEKFNKVVTDENLKDFPGIPNFASPKSIRLNVAEDLNGFISITDKLSTSLASNSNEYAIKDAVEKFNEDMKDQQEKVEEEINTVLNAKKEEMYKPSAPECKEWMDEIKDAKNSIKSIKSTAADTIKALNSMKSNFAKTAKEDKSNEIAAKRSNAAYQCATASIKPLNKLFAASVDAVKKQIKASRYGLIYTGSYCAKVAKGQKATSEDKPVEKVGESTAWMIQEANDIFVEECLGY